MTAKPLNDLLNWRYAAKKMDPSKEVPQEKVDAIIEAIRMAPTSSGTQPFELFVVTNADIRSKISEAAGGQAQITDGSHTLVFAAWDNYTTERIDEVIDLNVEARGDLPMLHTYYDNLKSNYLPRDAETNYAHAAKTNVCEPSVICACPPAASAILLRMSGLVTTKTSNGCVPLDVGAIRIASMIASPFPVGPPLMGPSFWWHSASSAFLET